MAIKFDFIGLINFFDRGKEGKLLLIPDGTAPPGPGNIPPHNAGIFVLARQVFTHAEWEDESGEELQDIGVLNFKIKQPCTISISGVSKGKVASADHDRLVPVLTKIDHDFQIVPEKAATIAQIPIRQGTLKPFLFGKDSVVSQLTMNARRGGFVTIEAAFDDGSKKKIVVNNGAEIVIANISDLGTAAGVAERPEDSHFRIYAQLDVDRRSAGLIEPKANASLQQIASAHPYLSLLRDQAGEFPSPGCSITG
jgi:hypothetical protein